MKVGKSHAGNMSREEELCEAAVLHTACVDTATQLIELKANAKKV